MISSPLFRLPREIRDEIYKYVLYNANGLLYKTGRDGISRLYGRARDMSSRKNILAWLRRCSLDRSTIRKKTHGRENNQLKYVCRRLYDETKGLDLHYNLVGLEDAPAMNAVEQGIFLLRRCAMLRAVAIKCSPQTFASEYGKDKFSAIVRHCMKHANVSVRVHIPYWSQANPNFVLLGLSYLFTLRADAHLIARLAQITSVSYLSDSDSELLTTNMWIPPNLRFFPREEHFSGQLFERSCRKHPVTRLPSTKVAIGDLKTLVQGWFANGL